MKKSVAILSLISSLTFTPSFAAEAPANFSFTGSGYGHGVGLSQIGGRAMAMAGESSTAILSYYFPGSQVETTSVNPSLRINIGHLLTTLKLQTNSTGGVFNLYFGDLAETATALPVHTFAGKQSLNFSIVGSKILATSAHMPAPHTATRFTLRWTGTRAIDGPPTLMNVTHTGKTTKYRHGQMQLKLVNDKKLGKRIALTNTVRLEDEYLYGVSEVPSSWPNEMLDAQVIASRSYALAKGAKIRSACNCNLYGSISDQLFAGYSKESEKTYGAFWKAAVNRTVGKILTHNGTVIAPFFTSSTGGVTETAVNAWGSELAYTVSVPDSASARMDINPRYATWQKVIDQKVIAAAFGLVDVVSLEILSRNTTGTVGLIRATSSAGITVEIRGETFRSRTLLPSAWFSLSEGLS